MFRLKVSDHFSSAHYLRNYQGKCENQHGHNWKVELTVEGETLNEIEILIDFKDLKGILQEVCSELDHILLNEHPHFTEKNPSSENIAKFIFERTREKLRPYSGLKVKEVAVYETERACAIYSEE